MGHENVDVQRGEAPQTEVGAPGDRTGLQAEIGQASENGLESHLAFDASKRSAEAVVGCPTKCEVPVLEAGDVEAIGIAEALRVPIGRAHDCEDCLTLHEMLAVQLERLQAQFGRYVGSGSRSAEAPRWRSGSS